LEIEAVITASRCKAVDDSKDGFSFVLDRKALVVKIRPEFSTRMIKAVRRLL
jgi:hypothetical protein